MSRAYADPFIVRLTLLIDDDAYLHTVGHEYPFGVIKVELHRLAVTSFLPEQNLYHSGGPVLESQVLHERSKKGGTHHVK